MLNPSNLYDYQKEAIELLVHKGKQAVFLPMGLGKTIITLSALAEQDVHQTLVFAPARVVELDIWGTEARRWNHTRWLNVVNVCGSPMARIEKLKHRYDSKHYLYVLSYDNMRWYTQTFCVGRQEGRWEAIIFDELSKMKHPGTQRFKAARHWLSRIPIRYGLTGTPVGNHLLDLWGELYCIGGEKPLGPRFTDFQRTMFYPVDFYQRVWRPRRGTQEVIQKRIRPWSFSLTYRDAGLDIPPVKVNEVTVQLPQEVQEQQKEFIKQLCVRLKDGEQLVALGKTVLGGKLRQFASGAVYTDTLLKKWSRLHDEKLQAVEEILDEQQGEPVLLFYHYKHELERLKKKFPHAEELDPENLSRWNRREIELLVAHPQSSGFGLNLQHGGNTIIWFTLPWSVELWEQANARLARLGQSKPFVMAHVIQAGLADDIVLRVLKGKGQVQAEVLESLMM